ncbi:protein FAM13A isoform X3 [Entelurus aequoreus]|uniref:protein FAM13A isoform X3 n=1 Tax=Entelurus aequoreus TaxID=161455 RepID=UPI002B1DCBE8|nr:protein FAM13A isoform X3 [Entelurus aequoreus]
MCACVGVFRGFHQTAEARLKFSAAITWPRPSANRRAGLRFQPRKEKEEEEEVGGGREINTLRRAQTETFFTGTFCFHAEIYFKWHTLGGKGSPLWGEEWTLDEFKEKKEGSTFFLLHWCARMGAGALTICHNKAAVQVKEDMKRMVQMPMLRPRSGGAKHTKLFGASLLELQDKGLMEDGVPLVVRRMVEHLRKNALRQEGLFRVNGNVRAVEALRQRLENEEDVDMSDSDICTVASLLKKYLRDLPQGLVDSAVQKELILHYQECGDDGSCSDLRDLLKQLPDVHHSLLRYLCHFLTKVESNHKENRMTAHNLATVFGPSVFHVAARIEALNDQNICNKILVRLIQNHDSIFETDNKQEGEEEEELADVVLVKVVTNIPEVQSQGSDARLRRRKVRRVASGDDTHVTPRPVRPAPPPQGDRPMGFPPASSASPEVMETTHTPHRDTTMPAYCHGNLDVRSSIVGREALRSSQDDERPISPFYISILDRTIRSTVEQHLFDVDAGQSTRRRPSPKDSLTARQRRRHRREQQEDGSSPRERSRADTNKENIPSSGGGRRSAAGVDIGGGGSVGVDSQSDLLVRVPKARKWKHNPTLVQLNIDAHKEVGGVPGASERTRSDHMEPPKKRNHASRKDDITSPTQTLRMKIQESPAIRDPRLGGGGEVRGSDPERDKASCEDVPRLDLTTLGQDNSNWGEPVPAFSSLRRDSMDREEARLSPHAGGLLIRQLLEEDSDPMPSPRFYGYGQCQQYLDDTEVPPSPPNAHSFSSRRRSSSLGSCDDDKEELTQAQLTKRIHVLKKKIHRFEEKFEDERKYRPSHSDKAGNSEVLRWVNELARLRKELKEHKLMKSEEDPPPLTRQRSNTLPKSFGSQLEKKTQQEKVPKPPVESTLEGILKKLQEKREEVNRPEDIKDMTREQFGAEKLALQKSLLHYESIHGRPVTKSERQIMKPLYDRYRLVKQILCRASTIPVIGSPSSKRRGPLLQPIIEGETALFFDDVKEEEEGSEDEGDAKTQFSVTARPDLNVLNFPGHAEQEVDGFISPVDELCPSINATTDMRLSNLHSATTQELVKQLQEAREEKKRIRKTLKEFEEQFFRQNGRTVQKEDRSPLAVDYNEYKHIKAKLRLLEVLISKRDATKLV